MYDELKKTNKDLILKEKIIEDSKNEIQKYVFHYERFRNHSKSRDICIKQIENILKNMKLLNEVKNYPAAELNFFEESARCII